MSSRSRHYVHRTIIIIWTANDVSCPAADVLPEIKCIAFLNCGALTRSIHSMEIIVQHSQLFTCSRWIIYNRCRANKPNEPQMHTLLFSRFYEWMKKKKRKTKSQMQFTTYETCLLVWRCMLDTNVCQAHKCIGANDRIEPAIRSERCSATGVVYVCRVLLLTLTQAHWQCRCSHVVM